MESVFWICILLVLHTYIGYPLWLWLRCRRIPAQEESSTLPEGDIAVVIAARDEEGVLPGKLDSVFASTLADRIREVWIASDGSTDHTVEVCESYDDARVHVYRFAVPKGKPSALNALVQRCSASYLLFTDARQPLEPDALEKMFRRMAEPGVGVVSGELCFRREGEDGGCGMGVYWKYEKWIRSKEARIYSVPGATGAIYMMERKRFHPLRSDTLLDDVALPMYAIAAGSRCVFASGAVAWDSPSDNAKQEHVRKRRTLAGCLQLWFREFRWSLPGGHPIWWAFLQHKIFRLLVPFALLGALFANTLLLWVGEGQRLVWLFVYGITAALQVLFYGAALLGGASQRTSSVFRVSRLFVLLNVAALQAWGDALTGKYRVVWDRSDKDES